MSGERGVGNGSVSLGEYAVLLALIAVTCIGAITAMKSQFVAVFSATGEGARGVHE
jgi:Flp pilus assembly pilin Flp